MRIIFHIERLILDGLPVSRSHGHLVQKALQRELTRLFATSGLPRQLRAGGAVPALRAGNIRLEKSSQPRSMGRQIAGAVYGGLGKGRR
jgi:hypothetical protein